MKTKKELLIELKGKKILIWTGETISVTNYSDAHGGDYSIITDVGSELMEVDKFFRDGHKATFFIDISKVDKIEKIY